MRPTFRPSPLTPTFLICIAYPPEREITKDSRSYLLSRNVSLSKDNFQKVSLSREFSRSSLVGVSQFHTKLTRIRNLYINNRKTVWPFSLFNPLFFPLVTWRLIISRIKERRIIQSVRWWNYLKLHVSNTGEQFSFIPYVMQSSRGCRRHR